METIITKGKTQSYSREVNNRLVMEKLKLRPYSQTELAEELLLSNATMSSISKELLNLGIIKIESSISKKGHGRKQVFYSIDENYGLILAINISSFQATIALSNVKEEILTLKRIDIEKYNSSSIYEIILACTQILMQEKYKDLKLRTVVISLPGRVNSITGELALSKQFDPELFKEKNFITNVFKKQFPDAEIFTYNDINLSAIAELKFGELRNAKNAIFISVDYGIGGSLIIGGNLFEGDVGYCGEFGLIKVTQDNQTDFLDEFISFRYLIEQVKKITNEEDVTRTRVIELYHTNEEVKALVNKSAKTLGQALKNIIEILDISTVVISGRAIEFKDEYLAIVKEELSELIYSPKVSFSTLGR
ncbi:MAG: ROK family protein, partial [Bacilli bacterium]